MMTTGPQKITPYAWGVVALLWPVVLLNLSLIHI